jgi:hypothetical protein
MRALGTKVYADDLGTELLIEISDNGSAFLTMNKTQGITLSLAKIQDLATAANAAATLGTILKKSSE